MSILTGIQEACQIGEVGEVTFIRISCYQDASFSIEELEEKIIAFMNALTDRKIETMHRQTNQDAILIMGRLDNSGLFNLSIATTVQGAEPLLRVEIVGESGMVQYDTSSDNAFSGKYQLDLLKDEPIGIEK